MRIVVVSPPRSGNHWIKCLLSEVYDLRIRGGEKKPDTWAPAFRKFVEAGGFPDGTIVHQHGRYTAKLCDAIAETPAHIVTIVRDPYDAFVSYYYWVQARKPPTATAAERSTTRPRARMLGKPLSDPEVVDYIAGEFGSHLEKSNGWVQSGRSIVVRYEDLHADQAGTLKRVTDQIEPVDPAKIERAIAECTIEKMRQRFPKMARTVRKGAVGDSHERLGDVHLAAFRDHHGDLIRSLGYEVR